MEILEEAGFEGGRAPTSACLRVRVHKGEFSSSSCEPYRRDVGVQWTVLRLSCHVDEFVDGNAFCGINESRCKECLLPLGFSSHCCLSERLRGHPRRGNGIFGGLKPRGPTVGSLVARNGATPATHGKRGKADHKWEICIVSISYES